MRRYLRPRRTLKRPADIAGGASQTSRVEDGVYFFSERM
jgi:hypothetical protein